jgi:hypothetical protein
MDGGGCGQRRGARGERRCPAARLTPKNSTGGFGSRRRGRAGGFAPGSASGMPPTFRNHCRAGGSTVPAVIAGSSDVREYRGNPAGVGREGSDLGYLTGTEASGAYFYADRAAADTGTHGMKVRIPSTFCDVMGVAHITPDDGSFTADVTDSTHNSPPKTYVLYQAK